MGNADQSVAQKVITVVADSAEAVVSAAADTATKMAEEAKKDASVAEKTISLVADGAEGIVSAAADVATVVVDEAVTQDRADPLKKSIDAAEQKVEEKIKDAEVKLESVAVSCGCC